MGKEAKKKKNRKGKAPVGACPSSVSTVDDDNLGASEANKHGSLGEMVDSALPANRLTACSTWTMLFEGIANRGQEESGSSAGSTKKKSRKGDKTALQRLLQAGAPGRLAGLLAGDPEPRVRGAAATTLRALLAAMGSLNATAAADEVARAGLTAALLSAVKQGVEGVAATATAAAAAAASADAALTAQQQPAAAMAQHSAILEPALAALAELLHLSPSALFDFSTGRCDGPLIALLDAASQSLSPPLGGVPADVLRRAAHVLHVALERNPALALEVVKAPAASSSPASPGVSGSSGRDSLAASLARLHALSETSPVPVAAAAAVVGEVSASAASAAALVGDAAAAAVPAGPARLQADEQENLRVCCVHVAGALVNLHLSLAGSDPNEGPDKAAATATAVAVPLLAQLNALASLPHMPPLPALAATPTATAAAATPIAATAATTLAAAEAEAAAAAQATMTGASATVAPPPGQGFERVAAPEDAPLREVWRDGCERMLLVLEVLNDLAAGDVEDDDEEDEEDEGGGGGGGNEGEWGSDDEEQMDAVASARTAAAAAAAGGRGSGGGAVATPAAAKRVCLTTTLAALHSSSFSSSAALAGSDGGGGGGSGALGFMLGFMQQLMEVPATHGLAHASMPLALLGNVCDLRAHCCLVVSRLAGCLKQSGGSSSGGGGGGVDGLVVFRSLVGFGRLGFEESLRLGSINTNLSGPWLSALSNALLKTLQSDRSLGTTPEVALAAAAPAAGGAAGGGETSTNVAPAQFLRLLSTRGPSVDVKVLAVRCSGLLSQRWFVASQAASGGAAAGAGGGAAQLEELVREQVSGALLVPIKGGGSSGGGEGGSCEVVAACLDQLMDLFGSDDGERLHGLYLSAKVHQRIAGCLPDLKANLRQGSNEREAMGREASAHVKEVLLNTQRFLKYKAKNFPGCA